MNKSIVFMILSVLAFTTMNVIVKYLSDFGANQLVFFRSIGTLCFTVPLLLKSKVSFLGNHKKLLLLRGVVGLISLVCFFESLKHLSIGTAVSIRYTSPIFAAILAFILLKEKVKIIQWFVFLFAFLGVLLVKGFSLEISSLGLLLILVSAFFQGFVFVIIRKIGSKENPLVIVNYFMIITFIYGAITSISNWKNPTINQWILLLSLGVFGYIGQVYMTKAFQNNETNFVAPLKYLEVIFTIIFGVLFFNEYYSLLNILGVFFIISGLMYNIYLKRKN